MAALSTETRGAGQRHIRTIYQSALAAPIYPICGAFLIRLYLAQTGARPVS
jgi:hypothetical protein